MAAPPNATHQPATATYAVLDNRVTGVEKAVNKVEGEIVRLETNMAQGFRSLEGSIATLSSSMQGELSKRDKTPWPLIISGIGVFLTFIVVTGGLVYAPIAGELRNINDDVMQMKRDARLEFKALRADMINRNEVELLIRYRDLAQEKDRDWIKRIERDHEKLEAEVFWRRSSRAPMTREGDGK